MVAVTLDMGGILEVMADTDSNFIQVFQGLFIFRLIILITPILPQLHLYLLNLPFILNRITDKIVRAGYLIIGITVEIRTDTILMSESVRLVGSQWLRCRRHVKGLKS